MSQPDLLEIESILVSTGSNLNDDVFLPEELFAAVVLNDTVRDKPINWEHDQSHIIGHMTDAFIVEKDTHDTIDDLTKDNLPDNFDVLCHGVVYKFIRPEESKKLTDPDSELAVSMEAYFNSFDYLIGDKVVKRNEATAFLDKHLRINGGFGVYAGKTVKRVLRSLVFAGKGIVEHPANPDSVIKSVANETKQEEKLMSDTNDAKVTELEKTLETVKSEKDSLASVVADKDNTISDLEAKLSDTQKELEELKVNFANLTKEKSDLDSKLAEMEKDIRLEARLSELSKELSIDKDSDVMKLMSKSVRDLDDDEYAQYKDNQKALCEYLKSKTEASDSSNADDNNDDDDSDDTLETVFDAITDATDENSEAVASVESNNDDTDEDNYTKAMKMMQSRYNGGND